MQKIKIILLEILAIPLWIAFKISTPKIKVLIEEDVCAMNQRKHQNRSLLYWLAAYPSYRNLFYIRIPAIRHYRLLMPLYSNFSINAQEGIGGGCYVLSHPFSTIVNAKKIGKNFDICQLSTIGNKMPGRNDLVPSIGDNVRMGANSIVIGDITIGNNVIIGAGSVVVKNIPDNCVVAGNPAKVIRKLETNINAT